MLEQEEVGSRGLERLEGPGWEGRGIEGAVAAGWGRLVALLEEVRSVDREGRVAAGWEGRLVALLEEVIGIGWEGRLVVLLEEVTGADWEGR